MAFPSVVKKLWLRHDCTLKINDVELWPWPCSWDPELCTWHTFLMSWTYLWSFMAFPSVVQKLWLGQDCILKINDLELWPWPYSLDPELCARHTFLISWTNLWSFMEFPSVVKMLWLGHEYIVNVYSKWINLNSDLDLAAGIRNFTRDTPSWCPEHTCEVSWNSLQ